MPSVIQADLLKDASATKTLATLSSSAVTLHSDVTFPAGHILGVQGAIATDSSSSDYSFTVSTTTSNVASVTLGTDYSTSALSSASNKVLVSVSLQVAMAASAGSSDSWSIALAGDGITNYSAGGLPLNTDFHFGVSGYFKANLAGIILVTPGQNNPTYGIYATLASGSANLTIQFVQYTFMEVQA